MATTRRRKRKSPARQPAATNHGSLRLVLVLAVLVAINLYVFLLRDRTSIPDVMEQAALAGETAPGTNELVPPTAGDGEPGEADDPGSAIGEGMVGDDAEADEPEEDTGNWVEGKVEKGDSLGRILVRENMTPPEADEVIRALRPHMDFRAIRPGQDYRLRFDSQGRLMEFEFHLSRTQIVRAVRNEQGALEGRVDKSPTEVRHTKVGGRIDSSLYQSIKDSGEDTSLVGFFVDVFAFDLNFYIDTHAGDSFRMIVEKEYLETGEFLRYGRVLAAEYSGKAGTFHAFRWKEPGAREERYFDAKGRSIERSLLKTPLKYARISSKFNPKRMHPILHVQRGHFGVDYAAPTGTPVWAAASGKITFRGWNGGAGNCVIIHHDNGLQTIYMHLSKFRKGQKVGQRIRGKTVIGYVGTTGLSTGPHLHFSVKQNGRYVDPLKLEPSRGRGVPKKHLQQFRSDTQELVAALGNIEVAGGSPRAAAPDAE